MSAWQIDSSRGQFCNWTDSSWVALVGFTFACLATHAHAEPASPGVRGSLAQPLVVGEQFDVESDILHERRHINVYSPQSGIASAPRSLPVLYMPDGGLEEDFLHVAGLVQVLVGNGSMRPFLLVGIENTQRRRDLTGPTLVASDRAIAPQVGGSQAFRDFIRRELKPEIGRRYAVTGESAVMGESLAGLFVIETLIVEPDLFDAYLAFDPSLWWNNQHWLTSKLPLPVDRSKLAHKLLYLGASGEAEPPGATTKFCSRWRDQAPEYRRCVSEDFNEERHATIYHPAALRGLRMILGPG
ncbi:MAG: alpha/beta hydrolase-fold protein [Steroidobacteraceae bacterium]